MTGGAAIARVCIDSPLPHLDRLFDYVVPSKLAGVVGAGSRVRVRFAGRLVGGVVCELANSSAFAGKLAPLNSAAARPSFTPAALDLASTIAARYGGSRWDVLRLMAPPRVASVEKRDWEGAPRVERDFRQLTGELAHAWDRWGGSRVADDIGRAARLVWEALPELPTQPDAAQPSTPIPTTAILGAVAAALSTEQGADGSAIVVLPDERALRAFSQECRARGMTGWTARSGGEFAQIHTADGPSQRYGSYMAAMLGNARIVVGTRPAVMTPVPNLRLLVIWDDGNSVYDERHAPYAHVRTVAALRAEREQAALLIGGFAQSVPARALVEHGFAQDLRASRRDVREATPAIHVADDQMREREGGTGWHWMPSWAWRRASKALQHGPVLVLVPRAGYVRATACAKCREGAECRECSGHLALAGAEHSPTCTDCGTVNADWHCPHCGGADLAHVRQGVERIAEQLESMAPAGTRVAVSSSGAGILPDDAVDAGLVVATPGAVPAFAGGYAHAVFVDAGALVGHGLDGEEDAARLILNAAAHVRARGRDGGVSLVGDLPPAVARGVASWAPADLSGELYRERAEIGLPPFRRVVAVEGSEPILAGVGAATVNGVAIADHPHVATVPSAPGTRTLLCSRGSTQSVVDALRGLQRELSAQGAGELRMHVDGPLDAPR